MRVDDGEERGDGVAPGSSLACLVAIQRDALADLVDGRAPDRVAASLLEAACLHLGCEVAWLTRPGRGGRGLDTVAARGTLAGTLRGLVGADGAVERVLTTGRAERVEEAPAIPASAAHEALPAGTLILHPVPLGERVVGALCLRAGRRLELGPSQRAFIEGVASLCGPLVGRGPLPLGDARSEDQVVRAHKLESLGQLAGGIAHDFNNILGVILGYVELAKMNMREVEPKVHRHLELALSTLGRARALADRLLDFSRESRRAPDLCDLNEAVLEVRDLLSETLDRRIEFEVNLGSELPPPPLGLDDLRQVVTNLCLNAAAAMPQGGRITVDTFRREVKPGGLPELPPGTYCGLRVRDTGPGVPADLRARIFRPYYTTRPRSGSGMGLWVARDLVERFDGRIEVSADAGGAEFTVWMPSELRVWPREESAEGASRAAGGTIDVLVVDDEPGVRDITRAFLEIDGYTVIEAGTGAEALRALNARPGGIRVVFLDHLLPDVRGAELAWQIDRMEGAPLLVLVTGLPDAAAQELPAGTRVLPKPFLHDDVSRMLREELGVRPAGV